MVPPHLVRRPFVGLTLLLVAVSGCEGRSDFRVGGGLGETAPPESVELTPWPEVPPAFDVGPAPLRRLTRAEYDRTVQAVFGTSLQPSAAWPEDGMGTGFTTDLSGQSMTAELAEQMLRSAGTVAEDVVARLGILLPCSKDTTVTASACGQQFLEKYGRLGFRRPLTDADRALLKRSLDFGLARGGLPKGVELVTRSLLLSPHFLYKLELGGREEVREGVTLVRLPPHALAVRIAYALTRGPPDAELRQAAEQDALRTSEQLLPHIQRLLKGASGRAAAEAFFAEWLRLDRLDQVSKDPSRFPEFTPALRTSMQRGIRALISRVLFDSPQGTISELLTTRQAYVDATLAPLYGLTAPAAPGFQEVTHEPRAGILTDVGLMTALAGTQETSPVARGVFIYQHLLCQPAIAPPENLNVQPPPPDPTLTTRERFAAHRSSPSCSGCHALFDPPGFALEQYDPLGRFRTLEHGLPIDAQGSITLEGQPLSFNGALELGTELGRQKAPTRCLAQRWFTYAWGRPPAESDGWSLYDVAHAQQDRPMRETISAMVISPSFTHRRPEVVEACP
jgi:hypothetical protein